MNAQMLLENFWHIANAPGGVNRLREMILQLAVTGTLTNRDQNDTEADVLFRLNQQHRDRLIEKKELQAQKPLPQIDVASVPWVLPDTWKWCRLGQVTSYGSTDKAEYSDVNSETWVLELEDIEKETSRLLSKVRAKDRKFLSSKNQFVRGQVLYGKLRPYLDKVVIADEDGVCTTEIIPIFPFDGIIAEYLRWYLKCPYFKSYANNSTHGMNLPRLGTEPARLSLFAFPPIEEQKRIVAKVDELMALCDKLEAQQQERERRFPVLSRACHARFVESPSLDNLRAIFDEVGAVSTEDLRKTILDLAVQGRLVRQELSDPVPSETFDEIKPIKTINDRFPKPWIISKYENLTDLITSGSRGWKEYYSNSGAIFVRAQNIKTDCLILNDIAYVSLPNKVEGKRSLIKKWDILITITGANVTKTALVKDDISEAYVSQHIALTRPKWPEIAEWLYLCFVSPAIGRGELERLAYGDKPGLNLNNIRDLKFPIPPLNEQRRIVAKVDQLMTLIDKLEEQQTRKAKVAEAFAQAAVSAITGTEIKEPEKMKAPKTELVSRLQTKNTPNATDPAPLAKLLTDHNGELPAKSLWQRSGLEIDAF